jgi:hypothetical protein
MTEPANIAQVEEAVAALVNATFAQEREVSTEELHRIICDFLNERQANQADSLRMIGASLGLLPAMVNIALMQVGLVPFDNDELLRLNQEAQRQWQEASDEFRRRFGDQS